MAITDLKFTESEFVNKDISSLPNQVVGQADFLKAKFDNIGKNMVALGRFNDLIDALVATGSGVDASKLGGQLPAHYAKQSDMQALQVWQGSVSAPKTFKVITMLSSLAYDAGWSWDDGFSINIIVTCAGKEGTTDLIPQNGAIGNLNGTGFAGPAATLNFPCICQKANGTVAPGWAWVKANGEICVYSPMGAVHRVSTYITYPK